MSDVFLSHSSKDKDIADKLANFLESKGLTCWIAPRDIVPGSDWAASISTAITTSKVFLLIYSANSAASGQCSRELSIAETKNGVFVVPYKTDDTALSGSYEYYLIGSHWVAANCEKGDYKLEELYNVIAGLTGKSVTNITNNTYIDNLHIHTSESTAEPSSAAAAPPPAAPQPAPAAAAGAVYCRHCGAKLPPNAQFCNNCGQTLAAAPAAAGAAPKAKKKANIAAIICAVIAGVFSFVFGGIFLIIPAIIALIFAIMGKNRAVRVSGIVCTVISGIFFILAFISIIDAFTMNDFLLFLTSIIPLGGSIGIIIAAGKAISDE